jgi:hypothetical protein
MIKLSFTTSEMIRLEYRDDEFQLPRRPNLKKIALKIKIPFSIYKILSIKFKTNHEAPAIQGIHANSTPYSSKIPRMTQKNIIIIY